MRYYFYSILFCFCCMSCASSYKHINPLRVVYSDSVSTPDVSMEYKYNMLRAAGNKKYARKADDKKIQIIGVKFTNYTDAPIHFGEDVEIFADGSKMKPLSPELVRTEVKQVAGLYMLWSLLWVTISKCDDYDCSVTPIPVGFVIGLGNTVGASGANKSFLRDLEYHDMTKKIIDPGETVKGLLILRTNEEVSLSVRLK